MSNPNIPNIDILSIEMKEKYEREPNGTTIIKFFVNNDASTIIKLTEALTKNALPEYFELYNYCSVEDHFRAESEGQFFVKSSSYKNTQELTQAKEMASQDNARFHLFHNTLNTSSCPKLYEYAANLNMSYSNFYNAFVIEGRSIKELIESQPPLLSLFDNIQNETLSSFIQAIDSEMIPTQDLNATSFNLLRSLQVFFEQNANIVFSPTEDYNNANLIINPQQNSSAAELKLFSNNKIEKMLLFAPIFDEKSTTALVNDYTHGLAHIFLDHNCENYYACNREYVQTQTPNLKYLSIMSQLQTNSVFKTSIFSEFQPIQSLLPWDIAALRHSYGMPKPENVTYSLNNQQVLDNTFATKLLNNSLVCFSSIGYNTIDVGKVKSYEIDLNYDHLSNITNQNISFQFVLSYDTKFSKIILETPGKIILNKHEPANIFIDSTEVNVCTSLNADFSCENLGKDIELIQIGNFNETIHNINYSCLF